MPYVVENRGGWFGGSSEEDFLDIYGIDWSLTDDFTVELWINPSGSGSIFSFRYNRHLYNGNLWVADCFALVLDLGL
jgi:hypothetical protein